MSLGATVAAGATQVISFNAGAIGWLIGRAVHVSLLFPIGMLVGLAISIGFIIYRYGRQGAVTRPSSRGNAKEMTGDR